MISTCIFKRFLEKNLYVVKFPIFGHLGVRTPPLASSTKDLTTSRSFLAVFSSSSYGRAWPDLVQRRSYDLTLILVHPKTPLTYRRPTRKRVNTSAYTFPHSYIPEITVLVLSAETFGGMAELTESTHASTQGLYSCSTQTEDLFPQLLRRLVETQSSKRSAWAAELSFSDSPVPLPCLTPLLLFLGSRSKRGPLEHRGEIPSLFIHSYIRKSLYFPPILEWLACI